MPADPSSALSTRRSLLSRIVWPATPSGSFGVAFLFWPSILILIDLNGVWAKDIFGVKDFGLTALNYIMLPSLAYALLSWFRGFIMICDGPWWKGVIIGFLAFPGWFIPIGIITFLFFPFGRISSHF